MLKTPRIGQALQRRRSKIRDVVAHVGHSPLSSRLSQCSKFRTGWISLVRRSSLWTAKATVHREVVATAGIHLKGTGSFSSLVVWKQRRITRIAHRISDA